MENVPGLVPLLPCYMMGNDPSTMQYALRYEVPDGAAADSRPLPNSAAGSRLFEVNQQLDVVLWEGVPSQWRMLKRCCGASAGSCFRVKVQGS